MKDAIPAACIGDLPDAVLERCLGLVSGSVKERLRLALVSKRFAAAVCSPQLLRDVDPGLLGTVRALRSFTAWLLQHHAHVQRLAFHCCYIPAEEEASAAADMAACLEAVGMAGQLTDLDITRPPTTNWLAAMPSLRHLALAAERYARRPLQLPPCISGLTALRSLRLDGGNISCEGGVQLPASIVRVHLSTAGSQSLFEQISRLPHLVELECVGPHFSVANMAPFSRLAGSLTRLEIEDSMALPPGLVALTRLQHLSLLCCAAEGDTADTVSRALGHLVQLTCLVLEVCGMPLPASVAQLMHLERCYLGDFEGAPLPAGPWLRNLRWLSADLQSLLASVAVLRAAAALEFVEACNYFWEEDSRGVTYDWCDPAAAALLDWMAQHPPLRHVCFDFVGSPTAYNCHGFASRLAQLCRRRPGLLVHCTDYSFPRSENVTFRSMLGKD